MRTVKFHIGIGLANASQEETFEYPDETPDEDIDDDLQDWMCNYIDAGWHDVD